MSRRFVSDHATEFPVTLLCELVEVPRSNFYEWSTRPLSAHYFEDVDLAHEIYEMALILLCQCGEVFEEDRVEAPGEVALDASHDFAV